MDFILVLAIAVPVALIFYLLLRSAGKGPAGGKAPRAGRRRQSDADGFVPGTAGGRRSNDDQDGGSDGGGGGGDGGGGGGGD